MRSYAVIDRIEEMYAVCELELIDISLSKPEDFAIKDTMMVDILLSEIINSVGLVEESDVLIVEHDEGNVINIIKKDDMEKTRRIEIIKSILKIV